MKVISTALMVTVLIVVWLTGFASANPNLSPAPPSITVSYSPNIFNTKIILRVDITVCYDTEDCRREAWYSLDGASNISIPLVFKGMYDVGSYMPPQYSEVTGQIEIPKWSQGPHVLTVYIKYTYGNYVSSESKTLYIGQPEPTPTPTLLSLMSPRNQTTYNSNVPIAYSINSKVLYSYYALDTSGEPQSGDWKSFRGNTTLTGLLKGGHKIAFFIKTESTFPSYAEATVIFKVDPNYTNDNMESSNPTSTPSPSPAYSSPSPTVPELSWLMILPLFLPLFAVAIVVRHRKRVKKF